MAWRYGWGAVGLAIGAVCAAVAGPLDGQEPVIVQRDTVVLAPVRLAITAFRHYGVLVELAGRDPRVAVFLPDSAGEAWRQETFALLAGDTEEGEARRPRWSEEAGPAPSRQKAGLWLGYASREGRPAEVELQLVVYRPAFDVATILPLTPAEAQRLLDRLAVALAAAHAGAEAYQCDVQPTLRTSGTFRGNPNDLRHAAGDIVLGFVIAADGRVEDGSIVTLFTTDRQLEAPAKRFVGAATFDPLRGAHGPCRLPVVQPFVVRAGMPAGWEAIRKERIARTP